MGRKLYQVVARGLPLLALTVCLVGSSQAVSKFEWVQTPKHMYMLLPPTLITDGDVRTVQWSPNGAYLLVTASQSATTVEQLLQPRLPWTGAGMVLVYEHAGQHVRKVWQANDPSQFVANVTWLSKSNTAYVTVQQHTSTNTGFTDAYGVLAIDAASGRFAWVPGMEHLPQAPTILPSPTQAVALAMFDDSTPAPEIIGVGPTRTDVVAAAVGQATPAIPEYRPVGAWIFPGADNFWLLGSGGRVNHRIHTGPAPLAGVEWGADGSKWYFATQNRKTKAQFIQQLEDDGRLTTVTAPLYEDPPAPNPELLIQTKPMVAKQRKVKRGFNNVWLSSPEETWHSDLLVTPNGLLAELSPSERAVFYIEGGVAKVRAIEMLTDEQKQSMDKALRAEALSDVKQAGLALLMYSNDMDDMFPGAGGLDALYPYLKDASLLDEFNYTPPTDLTTTHIENPASTQIGYIDGPGGRAVVYSDGHAKWIRNPS